jgi:hypothetical protein
MTTPPSADSQGKSPREARPAPSTGIAAQLAAQEATLRELLSTVEYEPRLLDASLDDAHAIAVGICRIVKDSVFGPEGPLDFASYPHNFRNFDMARIDESDLHEVYADDLECHRKRRRKDQALADSDADKFAVVKRRRGYIASLSALQAQASAILGLLDARPR